MRLCSENEKCFEISEVVKEKIEKGVNGEGKTDPPVSTSQKLAPTIMGVEEVRVINGYPHAQILLLLLEDDLEMLLLPPAIL